MKHQPEFHLQRQVCNYLRLQFPKALFMSTGIPLKMNEKQALRNAMIQKRGFQVSDIVIFEPRNGYNGLFIELKTETPYKLNGELKKSDHLEGQEKTMKYLRERNYKAEFAWSLEMAKEMIDKYFE